MQAPLTLEILDLWPEELAATKMVKNRWALNIVDGVARWGYRQATAIRVVTPGFRDNLLAKGVPADKIHVISNWVDVNRYRPEEPDSRLARDSGLAGRFNVIFAGTMGLPQGLETVLEAAPLLADLPQVQFVLVGDGVDQDRLQALAARRKLSNVKFIGRTPPRQMNRLYALADVLLLTLRDLPVYRMWIPHKVFAYMSSGKPVLVAIEGDTAAVVCAPRLDCAARPAIHVAWPTPCAAFTPCLPPSGRSWAPNGRRTVMAEYGRERLAEGWRHARTGRTLAGTSMRSDDNVGEPDWRTHWRAAGSNAFLDTFVDPLLDVAVGHLVTNATRGGTLLDVGCGCGRNAEMFRRLGMDVTGIDLDDASLALARQNYPEVDFQTGDIENLSFASESFDAVFSFSVLQYVDWPRAIRQCHRVLKPGGKAVFVENLRGNPIAIGFRLTHRLLGCQYGKFQTPRAYIAWKELAEFRDVFSAVEAHPMHFATPLVYAWPVLGTKLLHKPIEVRTKGVYRLLRRFDQSVVRRFAWLKQRCWLMVIQVTR